MKVRFVSGPGVGRLRLLPLYEIRATAVENAERVRPDGQKVLPEVVVDLFDLLQDPQASQLLREATRPLPELANQVEVMPEGRRVRAVLPVH